MRRLTLALLCAALPQAAQAAEGAAWLKIPQGARSVAMGTAVTSIPGGSEGQWYNPASLGWLRGADVSVSRQAWLGQTRDDLISVAAPVGVGAVGITGNLLSTNDTYRDANGVEGATFSNSAFAAGLGYGVKLGWLSLGMTGKYLNEKIEKSQGSGYGMDLGAQLQLGRTPLRFGASATNLGAFSAASTSLGDVSLPQVYRLGVALDQLVPHLLITQELRLQPGSVATSYLAGAELAVQAGVMGFALRGGYESAAAQIGGLGGLALGAGVRIDGLKVDFAYTPYGGLGDPYRMSLGWDFAPASPKPKPPRPEVFELPGQTPDAAPMTLDDKMNRGKAALAAGRYAEAETMFVTLADEYPASPRPFAALFKTYMDQGKKAEAIDALEKKLEREPDAAQRAWLDQFKAQP